MRLIFTFAFTLLSSSIGAETLMQKMEVVRVDHALPGILAARVQKGRVVEAIAVGCARFDANGDECVEALSPDHAVRIASISKMIAAVGVTELVRAKKLDLDRDVNDYLGFSLRNPAFPNQSITIRMLLAHTSSVRDGETYTATYPAQLTDLLKIPGRFDAARAPGSFFTYCNFNYGIIGQIIEKVSGQRFDAFMQQAVFRPMKINAGYNWSGARDLSKLKVATLYRKKKEFDEVWNPAGPWIPQVDDFGGKAPVPAVRGRADVPSDYVIGSNGTLFSPQGGLRISVRDLAKIIARLANAKEPHIAAMANPVWAFTGSNGDTYDGLFTAYASGPQLYRPWKDGAALAGHFGEAYGMQGAAFYDTAKQSGWIFLITGFSDEPHKGIVKSACVYPGIVPAEADAMCALFDVQPR
jgi:CubicO group peptidase (beta-lactamase class C family)